MLAQLRSPVAVAAMLAVLLAPSASSAPAPKPPACGKRQAAALVTKFITAFDRGDRRALAALFAQASRFRWYSVSGGPGERRDPAAHNRRSLLGYFAARHAANEQLALRSFVYTSKSLGYVDFTYTLLRAADDIPAPVPYVGKGAVVCFAGPPALAVWSMGPEAP
jgi:hypothetical protein